MYTDYVAYLACVSAIPQYVLCMVTSLACSITVCNRALQLVTLYITECVDLFSLQ